jgi:hypothetical protein
MAKGKNLDHILITRFQSFSTYMANLDFKTMVNLKKLACKSWSWVESRPKIQMEVSLMLLGA